MFSRLSIVIWILSISLLTVTLPAYSDSYSKVFNRVDPSVVVIHTREQIVTEGSAGLTRTGRGLGSGVLISEDGKILTAAHVVQVTDRVAVEFKDGEKYPAKVISSSPQADVALLRLEKGPETMPVAKLGNSDNINIGDEVFVIGAPYGIEHTLTVGYLSGRRQEKVTGDHFEPIEFLQTDAAINKGNSGGPLFNRKGEVMGIVSHIKSTSGGSEGLGFATAINVAKGLLLEKKSIWTGLEFIPIEGEMALALNFPQTGGMLVQRVAKNSLGDYLGLKGGTIPSTIGGRHILLGGDVILTVNGTPFTGINDNSRKIQQNIIDLPYGSRIDVEVLRGGRNINLFTTKRTH